MTKLSWITITITSFLFFAPNVMAWQEADPEVCREAGYTCASVNVSLNNISNWNGGSVEVRCKGGQDAGKESPCCIGESATLSPGQSVILNKCDCIVGGAKCVEIVDKKDNASSCDISVAGGACGGTNGKSEITNAYITGRCEGPGGVPEPSNPSNPSNPGNPGNPGKPNPSDDDTSRGGRCECTYEEQCTENGKEGARTCNGANKDDVCSFSENCSANCSDCRVGETPENPTPPENPQNPQPPNPPGQPPKTPIPPINRCNEPCQNDAYCAETTGDNCTRCLPSAGGKTCQPPPGQPPVKVTPKPTIKPTPKPLTYNPAMCKCDGIEPSLIVPGLTSRITAKAYVGGANTKIAKIKDVVFTLVEGNNTVGTVLQRSEKIAATTTSTTAERVNYAATWDVNIPNNLKVGSLYRIFATINCEKKQTLALDFMNSAVLGVEDQAPEEDQGIYAGVSNWLQSLFGIRPKTEPPKTGPVPIEDLKKSGGTAVSPSPASDPRGTGEELKLRTVQPATITTKGCTSITFQAK